MSRRGKIIFKNSNITGVDIKVLNELSDEQLEYSNFHLASSSYLEACPGSGKTEVIGLKTARYINKNSSRGGLAVLTFTKSASKTLVQRVGKYNKGIKVGYPNFVGTFDSWIHGYILQPFAHTYIGYKGNEGDKSMRIVDIESTAGFLNNFSVNIWRNNKPKSIYANEFYINNNSELESLNESIQSILETVSQTEKKSLIELKQKFFKAGFVTYTDAEFLCLRILTKNEIIRKNLAQRFPYIIIDECQDLSPVQLKLLSLLKNEGVHLHLIGDLHQSIYEFRKVNPEEIRLFIENGGFIKKELTNNYRSCQAIVDVSSNLINNQNTIKGMVEHDDGSPSCIIWEYDDSSFLELPTRFETYISSKNLEKKNCAILARGKTLLKDLRPQALNGKTIVELIASSLVLWFSNNKGTNEFKVALNQLGKAICLLAYGGRGNPQTQYCPNDISPIDWRKTISEVLTQLHSLFPFNNNGVELTWSQWAGNLKTALENHWASLPEGKFDWDNCKSKIRAPSGGAQKTVSGTIRINQNENVIRCTTIHSVKGETLDAVLLVSSKDGRSKGGHYSHWVNSDSVNEEHKRFAYVACSRPKYFLVIAIPNQANNSSLLNLGFKNG